MVAREETLGLGMTGLTRQGLARARASSGRPGKAQARPGHAVVAPCRTGRAPPALAAGAVSLQAPSGPGPRRFAPARAVPLLRPAGGGPRAAPEGGPA